MTTSRLGDMQGDTNALLWSIKAIAVSGQKSELYGRCIVILAAEQYTSRLVLPSSQQHPPIRWGSHKDQARRALSKLAGPHLPASLKQLEKAVAKAKAEQDQATRRPAGPAATAGVNEAPVQGPADVDGAGTVDELADEDVFEDEDLDELGAREPAVDDDELVDVAGAVGPDGARVPNADPGL